METPGAKKWDFNHNQIFAKPNYMNKILFQIRDAVKVQQEFFNILGQDLKAVTGNSTEVDNKAQFVRDNIAKLESFSYDVYND